MKRWLYINWSLVAAGYTDDTLIGVELLDLSDDGTLTFSDNGVIKTVNIITGGTGSGNTYVVNDYIVDDYFV